MPLYFCISGLFYKDYGGISNLTIREVNKLLVSFVFWYLVSYSFYYLGASFFGGERHNYHIGDIFVSNSIFNIPLWFLLCLFWNNLIFCAIQTLCKKRTTELGGILIITSLGWIFQHFNIFNFMYIGSAFTCMPFFYMGYMLKRTPLLLPTKSPGKDFKIMLAALVIACLFAFIPSEPPRLNYFKNIVSFGNPLQIYVCAACFTISLLLCCKFIGRIPFVSWLGRYSIIVLVTHMILGAINLTLISKIFGNSISFETRYVINFLLVITSMIIVIPFCKKFLPYTTAQKDIFTVDVLQRKNRNCVIDK